TVFLFFEIPILDSPVSPSTFPTGDPELILGHTFFYHFAVLFLDFAFYYYYSFSRIAFGEAEEGEKFIKLKKSLIAATISIEAVINAILLYTIARLMLKIPVDALFYISVSLSVALLPLIDGIIFLVATTLVSFPLLYNSLRLRKRVPKDDPHKSNLLYLAVLAFLQIFSIIFAEINIILVIGGAEPPTLAFIFSWICVPMLLYAGYRGFFAHKSKRE
ncbi:MAG: hypothetical protein RBG13Loki_0391, partial [Promethearchaeota archaeon CR_4]